MKDSTNKTLTDIIQEIKEMQRFQSQAIDQSNGTIVQIDMVNLKEVVGIIAKHLEVFDEEVLTNE